MEVERSGVEQQPLPGFTSLPDEPAGRRYTAYGKQVQYCGEQYADAVSSDAANSIAAAMNAAEMQQDWAYLISQVR